MIQYLEIVDRNGGHIASREFESEEELFGEWPYAEFSGPNEWVAWLDGRAN